MEETNEPQFEIDPNSPMEIEWPFRGKGNRSKKRRPRDMTPPPAPIPMNPGPVMPKRLVVSKEQADQLENIIIQRAEHWAEARANWFFETDAEYRRNNRADYNSRKAKVFEGAVEEVFGVLGVSVKEQK